MEKVDAVVRARPISTKVIFANILQEQRNRGQGRDGRDDDRYDVRHPAQQQVQAPAYGATPGQQPQVAGGEDPYAAYGGYNNYVAMWYAAMAQQQQQQQGGPSQANPPGS